MHKKTTLRFHGLLILWLLIVPWVLSSQEARTFSGKLVLGRYVGDAKYDFKLIGLDTVQDGAFTLQSSNLEALLEQGDAFFSFKGTFQDNLPQGDWNFEFGNFQSNKKTEVVSFQYKLNVSGVQEQAKGRLEKGKPDGQWIYEVNEIADSEVVNTHFKSVFEFENGIPQKSFRVEGDTGTLVGRFLRNGQAHDEWTLFSNESLDEVERWIFENGVLQKIVSENGEQSIYSDSFADARLINLNDRYLSILELHGIPKKILNGGIQKLLSKNTNYYKKIDTVVTALNGVNFMPQLKVRVPHIPLDSIETMQLDSIKELYQRVDAMSESLLKDTQLNILRRSDEDAAYLYEVTKRLFEDVISPAGSLVGYANKDILQYAPRNEVVGLLWPKGLSSKTIMVNVNGTKRTYIGPNAHKFHFDEASMESVYQLVRYTSKSLEAIQKVLGKELAKEKQKQEFTAFEEKLLAASDTINSRIDSLGQKDDDTNKALENIRSSVERNLSRYSNLEDSPEKLQWAEKLVGCYDNLNLLVTEIGLLPARREEIDQVYQDAVWNPFTATIMNEEVKKRITNAYRKVLIPFYLNEVRTNLDCDNAAELSERFQITHKRMLELREETTSKLERKLRKEQNPLIVMELFGVITKENRD